jgi:NitT/TauT family transport system substrate-binding protein
VIGSYDHCVDLQAKGKFIESVVQLQQVPGEVEMVSAKHPEIKSPADFKGKNLGVPGLEILPINIRKLDVDTLPC